MVRLCAGYPSVAAVSLPTDFEADSSRSCTLVARVNLHARASCCVTALRLKCFLATGTLLRLKCFLATVTLRPRARAFDFSLVKFSCVMGEDVLGSYVESSVRVFHAFWNSCTRLDIRERGRRAVGTVSVVVVLCKLSCIFIGINLL
ncbi:hypothetical protein NDU88_004865 [Pleurodeles waltl]|uniref:Uncharacterized protein n=1 Tax=Pleurodeles waltl TaxID=8319 RepID=A0AAV7WWY2_PLEWA|nr:hypothetical protein NDU88_004865 [Pleurodeles waltl]